MLTKVQVTSKKTLADDTVWKNGIGIGIEVKKWYRYRYRNEVKNGIGIEIEIEKRYRNRYRNRLAKMVSLQDPDSVSLCEVEPSLESGFEHLCP